MLLEGDGVSNYREDDLIIIGANAPHFFRSPQYFEQSMDLLFPNRMWFTLTQILGWNLPWSYTWGSKFEWFIFEKSKGMMIRGEAHDQAGILIDQMRRSSNLSIINDFTAKSLKIFCSNDEYICIANWRYCQFGRGTKYQTWWPIFLFLLIILREYYLYK